MPEPCSPGFTIVSPGVDERGGGPRFESPGATFSDSMVSMAVRRVALVMVIYLALDLANPMMPGAFQIVGGCLQAVAGCQARPGEIPMPAVAVVPRDVSTESPPRESALRVRLRAGSDSRPVRILFRAPLEPVGTDASSSDTD